MSPRVVLYIPCTPQESWVNLLVAQATTNIADSAEYTRDTPCNVSNMRNAHRGHGYSKYTVCGTFHLMASRATNYSYMTLIGMHELHGRMHPN